MAAAFPERAKGCKKQRRRLGETFTGVLNCETALPKRDAAR